MPEFLTHFWATCYWLLGLWMILFPRSVIRVYLWRHRPTADFEHDDPQAVRIAGAL